jgi:hypothetical protein
MNLTLLKGIACAFAVVWAFATGWHMASKHKQAEFDLERAQITAQAAESLARAEQNARTIEQNQVRRFAEADYAYRKTLSKKNRELADAVAAAHAGGMYVRATCSNDGGTLPDAATATSSGDGTTRVRLPDAAAEFLLRLAAEADEVVEQLAACQSIIRADRGQ